MQENLRLFFSFLCKCRIWILSVLLACIAVSCETPPRDEFINAALSSDVYAIVPYTIDEFSRMVVDVEVNGTGPYKFIIDSAASRSLLYENLRIRLGLEFSEDETTFVHGSVINEHRPVLPIEKIKIGPLILTDVRSFSLPDREVKSGYELNGILGLDFLSRYAMYVNVQEQHIVFAKSGYKPHKNRFVTVPIEYDDLGIVEFGLPMIRVRVQDHNIDALLDLGASQTIANWAAANSFGVNVRRFLKERYDYEGVFSSVPVRAQANGAKVSIGARVWKNQTIDIANLKIFETLNRLEQPAIIVSANLLREEDYIIDFPAALFSLRASNNQREINNNDNCVFDAAGFILCDKN